MQSLKNYIDNFEDFIKKSEIFPKDPQNLYEPCQYLLGIGGKRIRPAVCLMANEMFGPVNDAAYSAAVAIELFHNFTLIHDDIMDEAPLRRGHETVHYKYGLTAGILSGDVMNIRAYQFIERIPDHLIPIILKEFNKTAIEVCEGQQIDMDFEKRNDVTIEEYIHMITLKTSVLVAVGMKIGALLNHANVDNATNLYEFGKNLGIAFQLQDDYLDTFGVATKIGKQLGGDILCDKKTYLAIKAELVANETQKQRLATLRTAQSLNKVADTITLFKELSIDTLTKDIIQQYTEMAIASLQKVDVEEDKKTIFYELINFLLHREY